MKKKQLTRERIFRNNQVVLTEKERVSYAQSEIDRQYNNKNFFGFDKESMRVDIYDPYACVEMITRSKIEQKSIKAYSKRMPNDVPNDRIAIQVAVSRLIKRLKND